MAKAGFWLRGAKGKLAGSTLYRGKGGTVQREIVKVTNPKTKAQIAQRILFSAAALFFKRAQQGLFRFAFSDKKQNWSDFNAFMALNHIKIYPTYEESHDPFFPLVGQFPLSQGYLDPITVRLDNESQSAGGHACLIAPAYVEDIVGEVYSWDDFLADNPTYNVGDIVTFVTIVSNAYYDQTTGTCMPGTHVPKWYIKQFVVKNGSSSVKSDITKQDLRFCNGNLGSGIGFDISAAYGANDINVYDDTKYVVGGAIIRSRRNGAKLEVSNSEIVLGCAGPVFAEYLYENVANAVASWGAKDDAILDGSLIPEPTPTEKSVSKAILKVGQTETDLDYSGFSMPGQLKSGDYVLLALKRGTNTVPVRVLREDGDTFFTEANVPFDLGSIQVSYDTHHLGVTTGRALQLGDDVEISCITLMAGGSIIYQR